MRKIALLGLIAVLVAAFGCSDDASEGPAATNSGMSVSMDAGTDLGETSDAGGLGEDMETPTEDAGVEADAAESADMSNPADVGGESDAGASASDPAEPGAFGVETSSFDGFTSGGEDIPLTIYLPQSAGPHPVVLFHHGFQLSPTSYASYGTHLASWGFVVVMPEMPGTLVSPSTHVELKDYMRDLVELVVSRGEESGGPFGGLVDVDAIGVAGHSLGGKIAMFTATEESRVDAVFGIDPVDSPPPFTTTPSQYPSVTPELMAQITVPVAVVGETVNATCTGFGCQACAPEDENFQQYYAAATSPALEVEVVGANHMSFLDDPDCGFVCNVCDAGTDDPATTRRLTKRYLTAFMAQYLAGDASMATWLTGAGMQADVTAGLVTTRTMGGF